MQLGLVSIQKNRGPWLVEWLAFHYLVGFRKFYFYAHLCTDETEYILARLAQKIDIRSFMLGEKSDRIQLQAYKHVCDNFMDEVDWMCFIDGDEFMFPTQADTLQEALRPFQEMDVSAVVAYNVNFGSSGHVTEPPGLITENFRRRAKDGFSAHNRVKSFVKGRQPVQPSLCSNVFATEGPTIDEQGRPVTWGYVPQYEATFEHLRFNHYVCQSYEYYWKYKRESGHADAGSDLVRGDDWWRGFDTNDKEDGAIDRFVPALRELVAEWNAFLAPGMPTAGTGLARQIVRDYAPLQSFRAGPVPEAPPSAAMRAVALRLFGDDRTPRSVLDVGFGRGSLGALIRANPPTAHWQVDGIDGEAACGNLALVEQGLYRHVWQGHVHNLFTERVRSYDLVCAFDVFEHLEPHAARALLRTLLDGLGEQAKLVVSMPLCFLPDEDDGRRNAVPATALAGLRPAMYCMGPRMVGTFVLTRASLVHIDAFAPTDNRALDQALGMALAEDCGMHTEQGTLFIMQD